jgi:hypothetical protein
MWELAVAGSGLLLGVVALFMYRSDHQNLGEARERLEIRDEQLASLLDQNRALRAAIESPIERRESALRDLAARGLSPDGTPLPD